VQQWLVFVLLKNKKERKMQELQPTKSKRESLSKSEMTKQ
jgi:hypothetical protein